MCVLITEMSFNKAAAYKAMQKLIKTGFDSAGTDAPLVLIADTGMTV